MRLYMHSEFVPLAVPLVFSALVDDGAACQGPDMFGRKAFPGPKPADADTCEIAYRQASAEKFKK